MKKRIISLLLCLCLAVGLLAGMTAAESPATVTVQSVRGRAGTSVTVPITISDNPGIACARFAVRYDSSALTLEAISTGDTFTSLTFTQPGDLTADPINLLWDGLHNDTTNGTIAELTFAIANDALEGDYPITVTYDADDVINETPQNVPVTVVNGAVTVWNVLIGDVNGDEKINTKDLLFMRQYFAGGYDVTPVLGAADLDGDGQIATKDLLMLRQYLAGGYGIVLNPEETAGTDDMIVLFPTAQDAARTTQNSAYKQVKAVVNGEVKTLNVDQNYYSAKLVPGGITVATGCKVNNLGIITGLTLMQAQYMKGYADFAKDADNVYTGVYTNGVITFDDGTAYSVTSDVPVAIYNTTTKALTVSTISAYYPAGTAGKTICVMYDRERLNADANDKVITNIAIIESNDNGGGTPIDSNINGSSWIPAP
ncbi:MAG: hypothetical protein IJT18_01165 [Oscillospiraceae bacterium]|nr:hypothetical protein [Oscillospiraceae bacterium]